MARCPSDRLRKTDAWLNSGGVVVSVLTKNPMMPGESHA
jgi:hypothetical protein